MKQTEAPRPRRNQFTETMRQSNPRQKMRHPLGALKGPEGVLKRRVII